MPHKRKIRENPLIEYANYCELTLERAKELMNLMHGSNKGTKYRSYNKRSRMPDAPIPLSL